MEQAARSYQLYVGIDIAAATCTAAWLRVGGTPSTPLTRDQDPAGYAAVQERLRRTAVSPADTLVVQIGRAHV